MVLDSIRRAGDQGDSRDAVVDAFFDTQDRDSVLGTYSIDEVGNTTLDRLAGYRLADGRPRVRRPRCACPERSAPQQVPQRGLELGMAELEAGVEGAAGNARWPPAAISPSSSPNLAFRASFGHREDRGSAAAPARATSRTRGWSPGLAPRRCRCPTPASVSSAQSSRRTSSSTWIQGMYCAAAGERPADPELEREQELLQQAVVGIQHQPGADHDHPHPDLLGLARRCLPGDADLGVESGARSGGLVHDRLAAIAVVADGRLADQRLRARLGGADRIDEVLGRSHAAVADALLGSLGPALVERLADQVDDAIDSREGARRAGARRRDPRRAR